jgi:WD40 repeat protein
VAFSPDGVFALTGSHDDTAKLWRLDGRGGATLAHTLGHSSWVESVAFSPDGHWALTGSSEGYQEAGTAKLWRIIPRETEAE